MATPRRHHHGTTPALLTTVASLCGHGGKWMAWAQSPLGEVVRKQASGSSGSSSWGMVIGGGGDGGWWMVVGGGVDGGWGSVAAVMVDGGGGGWWRWWFSVFTLTSVRPGDLKCGPNHRVHSAEEPKVSNRTIVEPGQPCRYEPRSDHTAF